MARSVLVRLPPSTYVDGWFELRCVAFILAGCIPIPERLESLHLPLQSRFLGYATDALSPVLDADEVICRVIPGAYSLEVSSPGLERPLRTPDGSDLGPEHPGRSRPSAHSTGPATVAPVRASAGTIR